MWYCDKYNINWRNFNSGEKLQFIPLFKGLIIFLNFRVHYNWYHILGWEDAL